ncbi:hypothetical protein B0H14DRAFT_2645244 [Mycena olivaceomarginata]|nr:hypothetical protein B0H14DRAFT_2645244 [Mycena olivaceomarginata]
MKWKGDYHYATQPLWKSLPPFRHAIYGTNATGLERSASLASLLTPPSTRNLGGFKLSCDSDEGLDGTNEDAEESFFLAADSACTTPESEALPFLYRRLQAQSQAQVHGLPPVSPPPLTMSICPSLSIAKFVTDDHHMTTSTHVERARDNVRVVWVKKNVKHLMLPRTFSRTSEGSAPVKTRPGLGSPGIGLASSDLEKPRISLKRRKRYQSTLRDPW